MPKIRDHRQPAQKAFLVSPWQSKRDASVPAAAPAQPSSHPADTPCMYSVATSEALLASPSKAQAGTPKQPGLAAAAAAAAPQSSGRPPQPLEAGSGWHTRPKQQRSSTAALQTAAAPAAAAADRMAQHQQLPSSRHAHGSSSATSADLTEEDAGEPSSQQHTAVTASDNWLADDDAVSAHHSAAAAAAAAASGSRALQGVAQLVLHPSGAISGHFVALDTHPSTAHPLGQGAGSSAAGAEAVGTTTSSRSSNGRLCLGLQGRQVLGIHSCYRDPEWALLQLSIIRYSSSDTSTAAAAAVVAVDVSSEPESPPATAAAAAQQGPDAPALTHAPAAAATTPLQHSAAPSPDTTAAASPTASPAAAAAGSSVSQAEAVAWVQRKGGDLVTLEPADLDDDDTEAAVLADNLGELPANVTVNFTAHTLLSGAAAAGVLQRVWPELQQGQQQSDLVVNLGDMSISGLPLGFLQRS